jgi:large subunit ribosomal protein L1
LASILRAKPASAKGNYVRGVTISTTMGPGIKIDLSQVRAMAA